MTQTTLEALSKLKENMKQPAYVETVKEQLLLLMDVLIEKETNIELLEQRLHGVILAAHACQEALKALWMERIDEQD